MNFIIFRRFQNTFLILILFNITLAYTSSSNNLKMLNRLKRNLRGIPYLENCKSDEKSALNNLFLIKDGVTLSPHWSDSEELAIEPELPFRYIWSYKIELYKTLTGKVVNKVMTPKSYTIEKSGVIRLDPYNFEAGLYKVNPSVKHKQNSGDLPLPKMKSCYFAFQSLPPIAVIDGGHFRTHPTNKEIKFNGANSIDINVASNEMQNFKYTWNCIDDNKKTCIPLGKENQKEFVITPFEYVKKLIVSLKVQMDDGASGTTQQEIEISKNAIAVEMKCERNCPPASDVSNFEISTDILATCDADKSKLVWEINPKGGSSAFNFNYKKNTMYGRNGERLVILQNVLKPGEYIVTVSIIDQNRTGKAWMLLKFLETPKVDNCNTSPPVGVSLKTYFTFTCQQKPPKQKNFYQVFVGKPDSATLVNSGFYPEVFKILFQLPEGQNYFVRVKDGRGPSTEVPLQTSISASSSSASEQISNMINTFYKGSSNRSISKLIKSDDNRDREAGIQIFNVLIEDLVTKQFTDDSVREVVESLKYTVTKDLMELPFSSSKEILQVSDSITKLMQVNEMPKSDPLLAKFTTAICKKMVEKHEQFVKENKFPLNIQGQSTRVIKSLTKCLESNGNPNYDVITPMKHNTSTDLAIYDENYQNYEDFHESYSSHIENLKEVTNNILKATAVAAKTTALTMAPGEKQIKTNGTKSVIAAAKYSGELIVKNEVDLEGVTLVPSDDFTKSKNHIFDILMTIWSKDITWWNPAHTRVATNIVQVQFWDSTSENFVHRFKHPVKISFKTKNDSHFNMSIINDNFVVPSNYSNMKSEELSRHLHIRRVELVYGSALGVIFHDLSDAIDVAFSKFSFPTIEDFTHNKTIQPRKNNTFMILINNEDYNIWGYIAILPTNRNVTKNTLYKYNASFILLTCLRWNLAKMAWEPACTIGRESNLDIINCECYSFSVIAGYRQNILSIRQEVMVIELELVLQSFYVIFLILTVTFVVFCILLILGAFKKMNNIYFLGDNERSHRYAYLLIVKTESTRSAGTTSNVTIRLTGAKGISEPHVLNYPDPKMHLLQKGAKDIFVVTTGRHLGSILKIEVWFDCIGPSPSWNCKEIVVYDMQTREQWYFPVRTHFHILIGTTYVTIYPTLRENLTPRKFTICNQFHTWHLWTGEEEFTYVEKLTVLYSTILVTYMLNLMCYDLPSMELRDSLDYYGHYEISGYSILMAMVTSLISFSIHVGIAWTFRTQLIEIKTNKCLAKINSQVKIVICWTILLSLIIISMTFLLIVGFWIPYYTSVIWATTCLIGIVLFNIFIYENIFIIIQNFYCRIQKISKIEKKFDVILSTIEKQRAILYSRFDKHLLRPYLQHLYRPLKAFQIKKRKVIVQLRRNIVEELEDLFVYGMYNIILHFVILYNRSEFTIMSKTNMESILNGEHTRTLAFTDVDSVESFYIYVNKTLIPAMQPWLWYENFQIKDPGLMIDISNKYIGVARLRQQKVLNTTCKIIEAMKFLNVSCLPEYSPSIADTNNYGVGWSEYTTLTKYERLKTIWQYSSSQETDAYSFMAAFNTYPGGGYVSFLGRTFYNSFVNLLKLLEELWVDQTTRVVFVEFLAYNANSNIFNAVTLLFEQSATGYVQGTIYVNPVRMLFVSNEHEIATMVFFAIFIFWDVLLLLKLSVDLFRRHKTFYKKVWLFIDLVINTMSFICIITFVVRMHLIHNYLRAVEKVKHNIFVSYSSIFYLEDFLTLFAGFLICIATARLWRFLRFGVFFRILEKTLSMAAFSLIAVTFAFLIVLLAFGLSGMLVFGDEFPELSSLIRIIATLIQLSLKPDQFHLPDYTVYRLAYIYFGIYLVMMYIVLFTYIIIIIMAYMKAQLEFSTEPDSYGVKEYIKERMNYLPKLMKHKFERLRGGEEKAYVKPKADEFRYANCLGVQKSKVNSMKFITKCLIRNLEQTEQQRKVLTNFEADLMLGVCNQFVLKTYKEDELELFFKGHFVGEKFRVVDEERIIKMAFIVNAVFQDIQKEKDTEKDKMNITDVKSKRDLQDFVKVIRKNNESIQKCNLLLRLALFNIENIETDLLALT